jgi:hypothetical protein
MQQSGQIVRPAVTVEATVIGRSWLQQISDTQRHMHPIVPNAGGRVRIMVAAPFMFGVGVFIVNATIPFIARELLAAYGAICGVRIISAVDHHLRRIAVMDAARVNRIGR